MRTFIYLISLFLIWIGLSSLSIRGYYINPSDIYESAQDIKINNYIDSDNGKRFVLKCKGIQDTIGILYSHFYPANNGKPTINNPDNWSITMFVHGKDRVTYSSYTRLKEIKYPDIYSNETRNIGMWLKQIDVKELISKGVLSYFDEENIYGLFLFYYLIPEK